MTPALSHRARSGAGLLASSRALRGDARFENGELTAAPVAARAV